ncbi:MAG: hypothetical protein A4E29_01415 [Methanomassiliicoccales archaeon PtaB.Bin134]|nr:MAG: hypothetical protein A4E29_01415 [Methanomassiliicoccales archaeon PtaB.Bin134]
MSELSAKVKGFIGRNKVLVGGLLIMAILLLGTLAYSGMWPPVYVVESASMQHSDTTSKLGIIDTGDLVLVRSSDGTGVRTYVESFSEGHRSFGDYGDVIVYERYGNPDATPIIHRAMMRLEYNQTAHSFDVPSLASLPLSKWGNGGLEEGRWWNLSGWVDVYDVGYRSALLRVDLSSLLTHYSQEGLSHDGIITMGDHNLQPTSDGYLGVYDQSPSVSICRDPVRDEWIVAEAKLELPWLGLVKLWVNGDMPANTPENSKTNLLVLLALLIVVPLAIDLAGLVLQRRGIDPWATLRERLRRGK